MQIVIDIAFEAHPDGDDKPARHYAAGETHEVAQDFGEMVIGKGFAHEAAPQQQEQVSHEAE